jgi:HSP20 family molecular chaperone IbpA
MMRLLKYLFNLTIVLLAIYGGYSIYEDYTNFQKNFGNTFFNAKPSSVSPDISIDRTNIPDIEFEPQINHALTGDNLFLYIKEKNIDKSNISIDLTENSIELIYKYQIQQQSSSRRKSSQLTTYEKSIKKTLPANIDPQSAEIDIIPGKITIRAKTKKY